MKRHLIGIMLILSAATWGIWCGGQYFNEARVIPRFLADPPTSVLEYNALPDAGGLPFFFPLNPLIFVLPLISAILAWPNAGRSRVWLVSTTLVGFIVSLSLIVYLAPLIGSIFADAALAPADEIARRAADWRYGNRIRLVVEFAGFLCSLMAVYTWPAESVQLEPSFDE